MHHTTPRHVEWPHATPRTAPPHVELPRRPTLRGCTSHPTATHRATSGRHMPCTSLCHIERLRATRRATARRATAPHHAERPHVTPPLPHTMPCHCTLSHPAPRHRTSSRRAPRTTMHCATPHREAARHAPLATYRAAPR